MLLPMVSEAIEPVGSMGDDTPLSVLATKPRLLYAYFKQKFAQVTNPPIDPLREQIVMALHTYLGQRGSLLEETPEHARLLFLPSPVLLDHELDALRNIPQQEFRSATISCLFPADGGPGALKPALDRVCDQVVEAVEGGARIIVLSDRGSDEHFAPIPMLLATGAVHHHLIRRGIRMQCSLVAETGEAREMHHIACLVGYGAHAVNPYLAFSTVRRMVEDGHYRELQEATLGTAQANYRKTLEKQLLKIMSKMGISAIASYRGAQIFEAIGIGPEVIDSCFAGTVSQIGGIGFTEIAEEALARHALAYGDGVARLEDYGYYRFRKAGEPRAFSPLMTKPFHRGVANGGSRGWTYREFVRQTTGVGPLSLRGPAGVHAAGPGGPARRGGARKGDRHALHHRLHVPGRPPPPKRTRRWPSPPTASARRRTPARAASRRSATASATAARTTPTPTPSRWPQRRFGVTPAYHGQRAGAGDQDGPGLQAGRGRPASRAQGGGAHRAAAPHARGRAPHLATAAPRHLLHRGPGATHLRPQGREPPGQGLGQIGCRGRRGGPLPRGWPRATPTRSRCPATRGGTGASPPELGQERRVRRGELGVAETQQVLVANDLRGRVTLRTDGMMRSGRDVIMAALLGRGGVRLRHGLAHRRRLHHGPAVPPEHVPHGNRHPGAPAAGEVQGHAGST